jgi:hypothetical protein
MNRRLYKGDAAWGMSRNTRAPSLIVPCRVPCAMCTTGPAAGVTGPGRLRSVTGPGRALAEAAPEKAAMPATTKKVDASDLSPRRTNMRDITMHPFLLFLTRANNRRLLKHQCATDNIHKQNKE